MAWERSDCWGRSRGEDQVSVSECAGRIRPSSLPYSHEDANCRDIRSWYRIPTYLAFGALHPPCGRLTLCKAWSFYDQWFVTDRGQLSIRTTETSETFRRLTEPLTAKPASNAKLVVCYDPFDDGAPFVRTHNSFELVYRSTVSGARERKNLLAHMATRGTRRQGCGARSISSR